MFGFPDFGCINPFIVQYPFMLNSEDLGCLSNRFTKCSWTTNETWSRLLIDCSWTTNVMVKTALGLLDREVAISNCCAFNLCGRQKQPILYQLPGAIVLNVVHLVLKIRKLSLVLNLLCMILPVKL